MSRNNDRIWEDTCEEVIAYIELKADDPEIKDSFVLDLRRSYADQMGKDRYRSRDFNDLVDATVSCLREVESEYGRSGDRQIDIIQIAAAKMVDGHFATQVLGDRRLADDLTSDVYRAMGDARREAQALTAGGGRGGRDRDDDDRRSRRDRDDDDRGGRGGRRGSRDDDRDRDRDRDRSSTRSSTRSRRDKKDDDDDHWASLSDIGEDAPVVDDRPVREERDDREYDHAAEVKPGNAPSHDFVEVEGPDYTKATPYNDYILNNDRWQAAHLSNWHPSGDGESLLSMIPTVYDANKYIKYYVMDESGHVREEFVEVTEDNRHLSHQLREESTEAPARPRTAGISMRRNGDDGIVVNTVEPKQSGAGLAELIQEIPPEQLSFSKSEMVDGLNGMVFSGRASMLGGDGLSRVDMFYVRTPLAVSTDTQLALIDDVHTSTTLTEAADKLVALKSQFERPVWEVLNNRFGSEVIRAAKYQFQFDLVKKIGFATAYGKLLELFRAKRGAEEAAAFAKRIQFVSDLACGHLAAADVGEFAGDLLGDNKDVNAVIFIDFYALVTFNETLDDLGIGKLLELNPNGLAIEQSTNRILCERVRALYERLEEQVPAPTKGRLLLSTADNRLLEVLPYAARKEAFILAPVEL